MTSKIERGKTETGADSTRFYTPRGPKEGSRKVLPGDIEKFEASPLWCICGYTKSGCRCVKEEPVCELCKGESEPGTCPCCE